MVKLGKEQPLERGESGNRSYLDHEATTSTGGGSSQDEQGQLQTLLHEILHGIIYDRAIEFDKMDEETIVDHLAKGIYQVLKDNKIF
mgnify:CR=1 FL=1